MSKHKDSIELDLSPEDALEACRRAISAIGWRILEEDDWSILIKEVTPQSISFTWAARIELAILQVGAKSLVQLNGSITGLGPIQKGHLTGQVGALRNKIQLAAMDGKPSEPTTGTSSIAEEIERLNGLRDQGALTDEEFSQAKAQLLKG